MVRQSPARDPWRSAPVGELQDPLLPRWFVVTALVMIPLAVVAAVAAFVVFDPAGVPVAARRPPPEGGFTNAVGAYEVGDSQPVAYQASCAPLQGVRIAGTDADRSVLRRGLAGLCNTALDEPTAAALRAFAERRGTIRFAVFEATGVDSTATPGPPGVRDVDGPLILVNARFARTDPLWIAPLVAHDAVLLHTDRLEGTAAGALGARQAEAEVCRRLLAGRRPSRGCQDAQALLALPDPAAALRAAGYR